MEAAERIDALVDALDRVQLGDEYGVGATAPWVVTVARWELFVTLVALIDRAVRDPFGPGAAAALRTAPALHEDEVYELAFAVSHAGEAVARSCGSISSDGF